MTQLACALTGHRPKSFPWRYDEQDPRCAALKQTLAEQIERLADAGVTQYLSGMALGVDVWAAQAVLALREKRPELKLHCILPCIGQEKLWSEPSKALYYSMIRQADSWVYTRLTKMSPKGLRKLAVKLPIPAK